MVGVNVIRASAMRWLGMSDTLPINIPKNRLSDFCRHYHIKKLSLFGSVLRQDFNSNSDVDFLVEFQEGKTPGFFTLAQMERELAVIINWTKVDLRTPEELSEHFRARVLQEAQVQYDLHE